MNAAFATPKQFVGRPDLLARSWSRGESENYTRWLARRHYENFHVVSLLLPRRLHQDFFNVYAFCRWADDLGDEIGDAGESLRLLGWWHESLDAMYGGRASHPVFVALTATVDRHVLDKQPFADLIRAFIQDQTVARYAGWDDLLEYCRYSANPVGRLVLALCGYTDERRRRLSDSTCTALQLANFWQDVTLDWRKGRVYIPLDDMTRHGYTLDDLAARRFTPQFRSLMRELVGTARRFFADGLPLTAEVDRRLAVDISLFSRGGMRILDKIEAQDYNVLARRPSISRGERVWLFLSTLARVAAA